jgi:hypothetical protein
VLYKLIQNISVVGKERERVIEWGERNLKIDGKKEWILCSSSS